MQVFVPAIAAVVSLVFAAGVFAQFLERGRPYQAVWVVGLLAWSVGTAAEAMIGAIGVTPLAYRLWYLSGAILTAAWLGLGSLYLQMGRRIVVAHVAAGLLIIASIAAAFLVFSAPLDLTQAYAGDRLIGAALPASVRLTTPFFNIIGTMLLLGVAVWSVAGYARSRRGGQYVGSNLLIAAGALLPAIGGSLSRLGSPEFLWMSELLGVIVMFIGFLRGQRPPASANAHGVAGERTSPSRA